MSNQTCQTRHVKPDMSNRTCKSRDVKRSGHFVFLTKRPLARLPSTFPGLKSANGHFYIHSAQRWQDRGVKQSRCCTARLYFSLRVCVLS
eukprot:g64592.t1